MDSLRPPPEMRPSVGDWPDGMQWLEMGRQMVETQGLEMFRLVGQFSACRMLGLHLGGLGDAGREDGGASQQEAETVMDVRFTQLHLEWNPHTVVMLIRTVGSLYDDESDAEDDQGGDEPEEVRSEPRLSN